MVSPTRLTEMRQRLDNRDRPAYAPWDAISIDATDLADLLAAHEALTAQVAALHEALANEIAEHRGHAPSHPIYSGPTGQHVLADTAAAAEAFKRQQRLEGAKDALEALAKYRGVFHGRDARCEDCDRVVLAAMTREASA